LLTALLPGRHIRHRSFRRSRTSYSRRPSHPPNQATPLRPLPRRVCRRHAP
jgi:hypothetical protein